jgi:hypothetical protein
VTAKTAKKPAHAKPAEPEPGDIVFAGVTFTPDDAEATPIGAELAAELAAKAK